MPHIDLDEMKEARREFTKEEWLNSINSDNLCGGFGNSSSGTNRGI